MASKADYKEFEIYLQQTQDKIGSALSTLALEYPVSSPSLSTQAKKSELKQCVHLQEDSNANPLQDIVGVNNNNELQTSVPDFVSIFAANNLVDDDLVLNRHDAGGRETWNFTLPANFHRRKSPPERPRTLTPPCTAESGKKRFRKRDWKFYVHGKYKTLIPVQKKHEYGFLPIKNDNVDNNKASNKVPATRYRTEIVFSDKLNTNCVNLNDNYNSKEGNLNRKISELQLDLSDNNGIILYNDVSTTSSSSDSSDKQSQLLSDLSDKSTTPSATVACSLVNTSTGNSEVSAKFMDNNDHKYISSNQNGLNLEKVVAISDLKEVCLESMNSKEASKSAFSPVHGNNVKGDNNVDTFRPKLMTFKSPLPRRSALHAECESISVRHEGTMARLSSESSTSDAYYRESSLSPSSPDYRGRPMLSLPPPPALEKHEARLKSSARNSTNARSKSGDRKNKKRSKSKETNLKRDASPSKTERPREGKVSIATQTHKSTKGYKGANKVTDSKLDNQKPQHNKGNISGSNVVDSDSFENANSYKVPILPMPVSKRAAMESSTSSDESGDYKKVNITALRERFMQTREKSKQSRQKFKEPSDKKIDSKNHSGSTEPNTSFASNQINRPISRDNPLEADSSKFTPVDKMETFDNDILENDMYNFEDSRDTTPVNGIEDQCTLEECDYCKMMQVEQHCQIPYTDKYFDHTNEYQQLNQIKCLNEAANGNLLQQKENLSMMEVGIIAEQDNSKIKVPLCDACSSKYKYCESENGTVVIPSREQRRMFTTLLMPVIAEDVQNSGESDTETLGSNSNIDSIGMAKNTTYIHNKTSEKSNIDIVKEKSVNIDTSKKTMDNKVKSTKTTVSNLTIIKTSASGPVSPGAQSNKSLQSQSSLNSLTSQSSEASDSVANNNTQSLSLLDRLHKKYYPDQYNSKGAKAKTVTNSQSSISSSQVCSSTEFSNTENSVSSSPKNETVILKPSLVLPLSSSSGIVLSPRLRKSSHRQAEKGEEGKPPRSPTTALTSNEDKLKDEKSQSLKEPSEETCQEIEAIEACKWLRAAGFPQYAQMYEDQQFPIDIASVEKDHDFLDQDSIQSIFRRLNTLNKCAGMKIEAPPRKNPDESDEEEECALSDKWRYQRSSRRWSRKDLDLSDLTTPTSNEMAVTAASSQSTKLPVKSCSSQDSLLTDNESTSLCEDSPVPSKKPSGAKHSVPDRVEVQISGLPTDESRPVVNLFDNRDRAKTLKPVMVKTNNTVNGLSVSREGSASPNLRRVQSEKVHGPKSFFKRIESFKTKKSNKKIRYPPGTKLEIGKPVVLNTEDMKERMERLGCKDISPKSLSSDKSEETQQLHVDLNGSFPTNSEASPLLTSGRLHGQNSSVTGSEESVNKSVSSLVMNEPISPSASPEVKHFNSVRNNNSEHQTNLNNDASDLDRVVFSLENSEPPQALSSFPKVVPNGYIEMENGNRLNYRTGSFNLGSHSDDYRENLQSNMINIRAVSEDREVPVARRIQNTNPEYRMSIYDNLGPDVDPQQELDNILKDLMENINGLNQSLGDSAESLLELGTFGLKGYVPSQSTPTPNPDEPLTKQLKQKDVDNYGSDPMDTSEFCFNRDRSLDIVNTKPENQPILFNSGCDSSKGYKTELLNHGTSENVTEPVVQTQTSDNSFSGNNVTFSSNVINKHEQLTTGSGKIQSPVTTNHHHHPHNHQTTIQHHHQPQTHLTVDAPHQDDCALSPAMDSSNIPSTSHSDQHHHHAHDEVDSELEELAVDGEEEEEEEDDEHAEVQSNSSGESTCSQHEESDGETQGSKDEGSDQQEGRERRDSGVGSSLTRAPSDRRRHRIRWHSFVKSHRPSLNSENLQLSHMSAGQLMVLRKLCLLKVTGLMEKYSPANRSGWNWAMPKFIKRFKAPDYKDKNVFGVPLLVVLQRTGQPLPQCMLYAMRCLRRTAKDAVGIFRKSGVRSRIQKLRDDLEAEPESIDFETLQPYDVADLIKQYFRELPECLLTNKLSETFISIFTHVPCDERLEALQCTVMLLPDENREVLQSLLLFLSDMASHSHHNQMTASNLAVCFAPSLFHMFGQRSNPGGSPKRGRKNTGIPDQKELLEQKAAHECLTTMITECKKLFMVPEDLLSKCRFSYIEQGDPVPLEELGKKRSSEDSTSDHTAYIESCIQGLLKESREKFKGWVSVAAPSNVDLAYKKVGDGHPLRLWKCAVDVEAPPEEVLNRVLRERHLWDVDLMKWRVVEKLDAQTEVFQYILNSMAPHPTRDFCELRSWRTQLPKGACVLVSTSVEHHDGSLLGCIRAVILASRYLIEPCGAGKSRLTHICRIDIRGHTPEWYNKAHGHVCATFMARIRDSFKQTLSSANGPETKI